MPQAPGATLSEKRIGPTNTTPKRICPCGARVVANNYRRHRRGDQCSARPMQRVMQAHAYGAAPVPLPCPDRCSCGWLWPCDRCDLATLVRAGVSLEQAARRMGLTLKRARTEYHAWERMKRGGRPKRIRRKAQALGASAR